jgi:hypothetical protein
MKKASPYLLLALLLSGLLLSGIACHLIFPFEPGVSHGLDPYFCYGQIYRAVDTTEEFTEDWQSYIWRPAKWCENSRQPCTGDGDCMESEQCVVSSSASSICQEKIEEYINEYMAPGFNWNYRNLTASAIVKNVAADCTYPKPSVTYGAPYGAEVRWNVPSASEASVSVTLVDKDGTTRTAEPEVQAAYVDFAERGGLRDQLGAYDPESLHVRFSDIFLQLLPFDLGTDMEVKDLYIQSIGTIIATGTPVTYGIPSGSAKFFFYGQAVKDGESGATSFCFTNFQAEAVTVYQGAPYSFFLVTIDVLADLGEGTSLHVEAMLRKNPSTYAFKSHQPYVILADKQVNSSPVDLIPDLVLDHDGNLDLDRHLWFENFETSSEVYLGTGEELKGVPLSTGNHKITLVVYDTYGAYNSDTMNLTVGDPNDIDDDKDGYTENQGDCDDTDDTVYPGAEEVCGDGIDQDCDGADLTCGDLDGDNDVDDDDFTVFMGALGKCKGQPGYLEEADFDGDGCVTFFDYQKFREYYQNQ